MMTHEGIQTDQELLVIVAVFVVNKVLVDVFENHWQSMVQIQDVKGALEVEGETAHKDIDEPVF